jgi:hypothetical protein
VVTVFGVVPTTWTRPSGMNIGIVADVKIPARSSSSMDRPLSLTGHALRYERTVPSALTTAVTVRPAPGAVAPVAPAAPVAPVALLQIAAGPGIVNSKSILRTSRLNRRAETRDG